MIRRNRILRRWTHFLESGVEGEGSSAEFEEGGSVEVLCDAECLFAFKEAELVCTQEGAEAVLILCEEKYEFARGFAVESTCFFFFIVSALFFNLFLFQNIFF